MNCTSLTRNLNCADRGCFEIEKANTEIRLNSEVVKSMEFSNGDIIGDLLQFHRNTPNPRLPQIVSSANQTVFLVLLNNVLPPKQPLSPMTVQVDFEQNNDRHQYKVILEGSWDPNSPKIPIREVSCQVNEIAQKTIVVNTACSLIRPMDYTLFFPIDCSKAKLYHEEKCLASRNEVTSAFGCSSLRSFSTWNSENCDVKQYISTHNLENDPRLFNTALRSRLSSSSTTDSLSVSRSQSSDVTRPDSSAKGSTRKVQLGSNTLKK